MLLYPKKVKFRRWQTDRIHPDRRGRDSRGTKLQFGAFGLKATTGARVTSRHIESARKVVTREVGKLGKYWTRIFPDRPYTAKAAEVGMGKGKGNPEGFCLEVLPGRIIFEVDNIPEAQAREVLRKAGSKLPIKTKIIARGEVS
ncbi:50S ribosomal protein L16 [Candidatus Nomurabacteria bacterium RIFCSPLOWO2_01_FULL_36_10b]|uniref:50S ribosomal protein L16 n=1 Tax=Candidatus Nomurabacteria bacterium RIFCSPLOWO2_01_FULL_36_10b TaxID=1801766 RepID=A0A1F6WPD5_9BACT|nr:MAG: 50S ribosomal protein L16 [Candidatus Nomurabacteria bacterium RIFCSPLOWO2_01_FULL_36_10b]